MGDARHTRHTRCVFHPWLTAMDPAHSSRGVGVALRGDLGLRHGRIGRLRVPIGW